MKRRILTALLAVLTGTGAAAADPAGRHAADGMTPNAEAAFERAMATMAAGNPEAALDDFEAAVAADPDNLRWGAEYRQAVIAVEAYDRAIGFFERLAAEHPDSPNLFLNYGYAYVDKIPSAGAVTQVILANTALTYFTEAVEIEESWLARYTRGNSYLYWPAIFGRTSKGIADLERAIELSKEIERRSYHARAYAALGDGHWRLDDVDKAREVWREGLRLFPGDPYLESRLSREGEELDAYLERHFATDTRVVTHLRELW